MAANKSEVGVLGAAKVDSACDNVVRTGACYFLPLASLSGDDGPDSTTGKSQRGSNAGLRPSPPQLRLTKCEKRKTSSVSKSEAHSSGDERPNIKRGKRQKKPILDLRFGCPFSKANPSRYVCVYGKACTNPPGLEAKRIIEHNRRVHSCKGETKCRYCGVRWRSTPDTSRFTEVYRHYEGECHPSAQEISAQPEIMTREQEERMDTTNNNCDEEGAPNNAVNIYVRLFGPGVIPNLYYDYFIPRHEAILGFSTPASQGNMEHEDPLSNVFPQVVDSHVYMGSAASNTVRASPDDSAFALDELFGLQPGELNDVLGLIRPGIFAAAVLSASPAQPQQMWPITLPPGVDATQPQPLNLAPLTDPSEFRLTARNVTPAPFDARYNEVLQPTLNEDLDTQFPVPQYADAGQWLDMEGFQHDWPGFSDEAGR